MLIRLLTRTALDAPFPIVDPGPYTIKNVLSIIFAAFGGVALIVIVLAGLRYTISQGDPSAVTKAKNTIIYAFVGLIISLMAFTIVTFVLSNV
jgi:high-affinity K+ transport system ATPase subunit B